MAQSGVTTTAPPSLAPESHGQILCLLIATATTPSGYACHPSVEGNESQLRPPAPHTHPAPLPTPFYTIYSLYCNINNNNHKIQYNFTTIEPKNKRAQPPPRTPKNHPIPPNFTTKNTIFIQNNPYFYPQFHRITKNIKIILLFINNLRISLKYIKKHFTNLNKCFIIQFIAVLYCCFYFNNQLN